MIFIDSNERILLYRRDNKSTIAHPDKWDLLGGNVEQNESPQECITRELMEEIEHELNEPILFKDFAFEDRHEYCFWSRAEFDLSHTPLHEGQYLHWFSKDEALALDNTSLAFEFSRVIQCFYDESPHL